MTILEIIFTVFYILCALASGVYSLFMQKKHHPEATEMWRMCLVFFINSIGWFICIPLAIKFKSII